MRRSIYRVATTSLALGSVALLGACGSPAAGAGYHGQGERIANFEHPVAIAHPIDNSAVENPVVLFGDATAYKGVIEYEITSQSGEVVASGETEAGSMGIFSKFAVELDLDPGDYTVTVSQTDSPDRVLDTAPFSKSIYFTVTGDRAP